MAVTLATDALAAALRLSDSAEETAEATRLLGYATTAVQRHLGAAYDETPEPVVNEACIRLSAYLFDQPTVSRGTGFGAALYNSGAAAIMMPWKAVRAQTGDDDEDEVDAVEEEVVAPPPSRRIQLDHFTARAVAADIADGLTPGTYLAQVRGHPVAESVAVEYAFSPTAPAEDGDYFQAGPGETFTFAAGPGLAVWVRVAPATVAVLGAVEIEIAIARTA